MWLMMYSTFYILLVFPAHYLYGNLEVTFSYPR
jgi:hypothetical protein